MPHETDAEIRQFLLGRLPADEQERFEARYFASDALFERALTVEDALLEEYTAGALSPEDRAAFERCLMGSERQRDRVELVRALEAEATHASTVDDHATRRRSPWRRVALATAATLVAVAGAWIVREGRLAQDRERERATWQQQIDEQRRTAAQATERNDTLAADLERERRARAALEDQAASGAGRLVATYTLFPGVLRDAAGPRTLVLPARATSVRLTLDLEDDDAPDYGVILRTAGGREVWRQDHASPRPSGLARVLELEVPRMRLPPGSYEIALTRLVPGRAPAEGSLYPFVVAPAASSR